MIQISEVVLGRLFAGSYAWWCEFVCSLSGLDDLRNFRLSLRNGELVFLKDVGFCDLFFNEFVMLALMGIWSGLVDVS